ncbi:MAG: hypothetical protein ACXVYI_08180 [Mycobacterium sp.]
MFDLPDHLVFCIAEGTGNVQIIRNRYQGRKAGQARAQCDALLLAVAVLQGHLHNHIGIPPSQVGPEGRQRLHYVPALLLFEPGAQMKDVPPEDISLFVLGAIHCGLISGALVVDGRTGDDVAAAAESRRLSRVVTELSLRTEAEAN